MHAFNIGPDGTSLWKAKTSLTIADYPYSILKNTPLITELIIKLAADGNRLLQFQLICKGWKSQIEKVMSKTLIHKHQIYKYFKVREDWERKFSEKLNSPFGNEMNMVMSLMSCRSANYRGEMVQWQ